MGQLGGNAQLEWPTTKGQWQRKRQRKRTRQQQGSNILSKFKKKIPKIGTQ